MTKDTNTTDMPAIPAMLKRSIPTNPITLGDWAKDLDESVKYDLQAATNSIRFRMKRTVEDILEIGKQLCAVREMLPQDQLFGQWREAEFNGELTVRMASTFMQVHQRFSSRSEIISGLGLTVVYALAAPSTPDEVVGETLARAAAGEKVTVADVKEQIAQAKALLSPEAQEEFKKDILAEERRATEQRKKEREEKLRAEAKEWAMEEDLDEAFARPDSSMTGAVTDAEYTEVEVSRPAPIENPFNEAFQQFGEFTHPDGFPEGEAQRWAISLIERHGIAAAVFREIIEQPSNMPLLTEEEAVNLRLLIERRYPPKPYKS